MRAIEAGDILQIWGNQVPGFYLEPDGRHGHFAVPGKYRVHSVQPLSATTRVILRSESSGEFFECTMYHLRVVLCNPENERVGA